MPSPGFLALEPVLVARLAATVTAPSLKILAAAQLAGVAENAQPAPALHVVYDGFSVRDDKGLIEIVERWLTVVAVRNVRPCSNRRLCRPFGTTHARRLPLCPKARITR